MIGWWGSLTLLTAARLDEFIILSSARGSQIRLACRTFFLTAATAKPKGQRELEFLRNFRIPYRDPQRGWGMTGNSRIP